MSGNKKHINLIIVLIFLFSVQSFSQQINRHDSLDGYNSQKGSLKPIMNYSVGSTFMYVPHVGTVTGFTLSPSFSIPVSPRLSVDGGIIAGRYYTGLSGIYPENSINNSFSELSVYGSASYHVSPHLTVYGGGIKQLANTSPLYSLPKSSYTIGSTYNFGNFAVGVSVQMSKWNDNLNPSPFNGTSGFYSPFEQGPGTFNPFGR
jgi:hypothetical protein